MSCGKKQKNIFSFEVKKKVRISFFDFPSIRGISAERTQYGVQISWLPIALDERTHPGLLFCGYYVYRLTRQGIIPKEPLNKEPLLVTMYEDDWYNEIHGLRGYVVRAVFTLEEQYFYSSMSRVVRAK